jgi:hypothetical protein
MREDFAAVPFIPKFFTIVAGGANNRFSTCIGACASKGAMPARGRVTKKATPRT